MRDWFEERLLLVLRERATSLRAQPCSLRQVRRRARRLVLGYVLGSAALVGCLAALLLVD